MRLSEYASTQRTYGSRKVPRSVQQSIPIDQIYEDGTWRCGNVYSQMWSMPDINFTMSDEDNAGDDQPPQGRHGGNMDLL